MRFNDLMLGERIRCIRIRRGLRQWELAKKVGVASYRVSNLERGTVRPTEGELRRIAKALEIDQEELAHPIMGEAGGR